MPLYWLTGIHIWPTNEVFLPETSAISGPGMKILWIPHTAWHISQRAHLFCRALADRHEVHVTDWVADFASPRDYLSRRYGRNFFYRRFTDGAITVHGIPRFSPALFSPILRHLNARIFSSYVQKIMDSYHIDGVVSTYVVSPPRARRLVFDLFDENGAGWQRRFPAYADEINQVEQAYLQVSDAVVAASSVLVDKARANGCQKPIYLIPNGIDLARYEGSGGQTLRDRLSVKGFLVGSIANHDQKEEVMKILRAAKILSQNDITFLIAGRGTAMAWAKKQAAHQGLINLKFLGYISPGDLPEAALALDVGLCPYQQTAMDHARSPMRLLVYSAAGIPVVCTDLEEVRRMAFPNVILVKDDINAFVEGIRYALQLPKGRPPQIAGYDGQTLAKMYESVLLD